MAERARIDPPSPNFGPRRDGLTPHLVVLHYTAMKDAAAALERLCDPAAEVSAHYLICRTGQVRLLVDEQARAWHAGVGEWHGQSDINSRSIGIELDNDGASPFAEPLMTALDALLAGILSRWSIPPSGVIGHSDMAPGRKYDPGPRFDWGRLERQGLATRPSTPCPQPDVSNAAFREMARKAGYTAPADDNALLAAVRLRCRPVASGPLTVEDLRALSKPAPSA